MPNYIDINTNEQYTDIPEGKVQPVIVNGQPVTESAYDNYYNSHPNQLDEVYVTPHSTTMGAYYDRMANASPDNYIRAVNRDAEDAQIRRNNYWEGVLNFAVPSTLFGGAVRNGNFFTNVLYGNNGVVPDNFYQRHPYVSNAINLGVDFATPAAFSLGTRGLSRLYRWGTTPRYIGGGAEAEVYSAPFSNKVYKIGLDPEHVNLKNQLPETVPHKFEGYTPDGQTIYSQRKMYVPNEVKQKQFSNMLQRLTDNGYYPNTVEGAIDVDAVNPVSGYTITDMGAGNIGTSSRFSRKYKLIDPSVLPLEDYTSLYYKKGGMIKKENIGKFTKYCNGKVTEECINKGKHSPDPKIRKRAVFAQNARKWNE